MFKYYLSTSDYKPLKILKSRINRLVWYDLKLKTSSSLLFEGRYNQNTVKIIPICNSLVGLYFKIIEPYISKVSYTSRKWKPSYMSDICLRLVRPLSRSCVHSVCKTNVVAVCMLRKYDKCYGSHPMMGLRLVYGLYNLLLSLAFFKVCSTLFLSARFQAVLTSCNGVKMLCWV